jgi:hypothetical protein
MRSAREGDELRTGTNMRALLSAIASGREEIDRIGRRHGWSAGVREEMLDRLQAMVHEPLQRGGDIVMSSIPYSWRSQAMRRVSKAEGVIEQMTSAITTEDWSLQHCHDYLVELEMVTSGALMALRLTANDISSEQVSSQAECIGSKARKARNMALELRQKHLDAKLQVKDRPVRTFQEAWEELRALARQLERVQRSSVLRPTRRPEGVQEELGRVREAVFSKGVGGSAHGDPAHSGPWAQG